MGTTNPVLYGSKSVVLRRGQIPVIEVHAEANKNCESYYSRPEYCLLTNASLVEGIASQFACLTPALGEVYLALESYVYLLPCERSPEWAGPVEPTSGEASSTVLVPFIVGPSGWTCNLTLSTEVYYAVYDGTAYGRVTVESVDGAVWYEYSRIDDANGAVSQSASVELPEGSYVIRCHTEAVATTEPFGFDAAEMRIDLTASIPPTEPVPPAPCPGDANADSEVNFADITKVLENWGLHCR
jgi:hypothetical protein